MKKITFDTAVNEIHITEPASFPELRWVDDFIYATAPASLPELFAVGGDVYVKPGAELHAPQLTITGGNVAIYTSTSFPELTTIGGFVYVEPGAEFHAPKLTSMHGVKGKMIALHTYALWRSDDGRYYSGRHGPLTAKQALNHWDGTDDHSIIFTAAIRKAESI